MRSKYGSEVIKKRYEKQDGNPVNYKKRFYIYYFIGRKGRKQQ